MGGGNLSLKRFTQSGIKRYTEQKSFKLHIVGGLQDQQVSQNHKSTCPVGFRFALHQSKLSLQLSMCTPYLEAVSHSLLVYFTHADMSSYTQAISIYQTSPCPPGADIPSSYQPNIHLNTCSQVAPSPRNYAITSAPAIKAHSPHSFSGFFFFFPFDQKQALFKRNIHIPFPLPPGRHEGAKWYWTQTFQSGCHTEQACLGTWGALGSTT